MSRFLLVTTACALTALVGCASVKVFKVTGDPQPEGFPFYLPRPYVQIFEPFVISSEVYLASGRLSPDGQYLLVDNVQGNLGGTLVADVGKDASVQIPLSQVRVAAPPIGGAGPQAGDGAPAPAAAALASLAGASAPSVQATAPVASASAPAARDSAPPSTPVGKFNISVTQSDVQFPSTFGRRFFDVVWMPDFDEKYVLQAHPGLGNANVGITMVQGWGLYGLDARIDNSAIVRPLLDFYSTGLDSLSKLAKSKIFSATELGSPQSGNPGAQTLTPGTRVSVKVTKVFVAAPGMYPILKPSEVNKGQEATRPGSLNARVLIPFRPYTNIAFNVYEVLVVEATKPSGDSPMNLQRYFDADAQGNPVATPTPPVQVRPGMFVTKDYEDRVNKVLAVQKGTDGGFWEISGVAVDGTRLKVTATLKGGKQKPAALATTEQFKALLALQSQRFVATDIDVTEK